MFGVDTSPLYFSSTLQTFSTMATGWSGSRPVVQWLLVERTICPIQKLEMVETCLGPAYQIDIFFHPHVQHRYALVGIYRTFFAFSLWVCSLWICVNTMYALQCSTCGFMITITCRNKVRPDPILAVSINGVTSRYDGSTNVSWSVEPIIGEHLRLRSATTGKDARLDIAAGGF